MDMRVFICLEDSIQESITITRHLQPFMLPPVLLTAFPLTKVWLDVLSRSLNSMVYYVVESDFEHSR